MTKKYTGEDPKSQLGQLVLFFVCVCPSKSSRSFWGEFHRSATTAIIFIKCSAAESVTQNGNLLLLFYFCSIKVPDHRSAVFFFVVLFCLFDGWLEMTSTEFK